MRAVVDVVAVHRDAAPEVIDVGDVDDVLVLAAPGRCPSRRADQVRALDVPMGRVLVDERHAGRAGRTPAACSSAAAAKTSARRRRRAGKERRHARMVERRRPAQRRIAAIGVPLRVDPGEAALLAGGDAHVPAEARIVRRGEADRADRPALHRLGLLHRARRVVGALVARQPRPARRSGTPPPCPSRLTPVA